MITFLLVAILGALLVIVVLKLSKKTAAAPAAMPQKDLANLKVTDAQAGDTLSISGAGDDLSDLDFTADRQTRVQAGSRQWTELSGPYRERRVTLRVSGDDEVACALQSDARKITLDELGLSEDDLAQLDERQNPSDNFEYDGKVWMYRISREVQSYRDGQPQPSGFYYWEFQEQDGKRLLAIRKAEGEPFTATIYNGVHPGDVTVYRGH